jgi:uncharacterized membrane protein (UPF0182 family)
MCSGKANLYIFDKQDPIIHAYIKMFPNMFKDASDMPKELRRLVRPPEDIFKLQYAAYGKYHVDNVEEFYSGSDAWSSPHEAYRGESVWMEPYYVTHQLPGMEKPKYMLTRPYVFQADGKARSTGWFASVANTDGQSRLVAFRYPKGEFVHAPSQIESDGVAANQQFAEYFRNWDREDSSWFRGNLICLPMVTKQVMCFEPIYLQSRKNAIPRLVRIVSAQLKPHSSRKMKVVWGNTYSSSRNALLEYADSVGLLANKGERKSLTDSELLRRVHAYLLQHQKFSGDGQYAKAGKQLEQAMYILETQLSNKAVQK